MQTPALELAFTARLDFGAGPRTRFAPAYAEFTRGFVAVVGGEIAGPRLEGRVVPYSGGDWPRIWASGLIEFEAHYMLEAADGTPIYIHNRGIAWSNPEVMARIEAGESVDPQPESTQPASDADSQNGEPAPQTKDAPEMQGPTDGDRPGTVTPPVSPPADAPTTDAPPQ